MWFLANDWMERGIVEIRTLFQRNDNGMTYSDAIKYLYELRLFGTKLGLENTFRLAELAGNPQHRLCFIHLAGTNGKGSTAAMLESIYRWAGYRVGLFTSPHLVSFCERIQANHRWIPEQDVARLTAQMRQFLKAFPEGGKPTFFEVITVMALSWFEQQRCQLVIWETGMGGRLDATNIVPSMASVITNVALDHEKWLGASAERIAFEKAGIIKPNQPVMTAATHPEALRVIEQECASKQCPLIRITDQDAHKPPLDGIRFPLLGEHQYLNAALALAVVRSLDETFPVEAGAIRQGLENLSWPGRMQLIEKEDGRRFLLDGAHNPAGAVALREAFQKHFPDQEVALVLGMLRDKDWRQMCRELLPLAHRLVLTPVSSERTADPEEVQAFCAVEKAEVQVESCRSLQEALQRVDSEPFTIVAGSLYLLGEALEWLGLSAIPPNDERRLNEWSGTPAHRDVEKKV